MEVNIECVDPALPSAQVPVARANEHAHDRQSAQQGRHVGTIGPGLGGGSPSELLLPYSTSLWGPTT